MIVYLARVTGREPVVASVGARYLRFRAVAIRAKERRAPNADFALDTRDFDAGEGHAVIDNARAGLGHAPRRDDVRGQRRGRSRAAQEDRVKGAHVVTVE